jgi:2-polyprenyl-3-methyl-5-hydroxy-6-metoxy-1,4-benzoquinol methylase
VVIPLVRGATVLDVGCGYGRWGGLLRTNYWEAGLSMPPQVDGVDGFAPNVEAAKELGIYRRVWHQMLPSPLDGAWDTVLACEILEHLPDHKVSAMLDLLEGAALRRVIVSTPNGPDYRDGHGTMHGFNDLAAHLSYVPRAVLRKRGYQLRGAGFGPPGSRLAKVAGRTRIARDLGSLSLHMPALGANYVAYKDVG